MHRKAMDAGGMKESLHLKDAIAPLDGRLEEGRKKNTGGTVVCLWDMCASLSVSGDDVPTGPLRPKRERPKELQFDFGETLAGLR
ncbi:unnamed protein product [Gongylonema pulchrum]|uniref:Uncharacterized protein n=1 Tax=Gongylonema pulchrum TaxID=637853 RepID=A0A3P7QGJ3_9BILA|nr:unnamed protein product [Gongylonema pulchrum]